MTGIPQGPVAPEGAPGPLFGLRVIELASEWTAYAGKLLADLGAEVVLVEPPEGAPMRGYGPFCEDRPDRESSLWWWHYQTSTSERVTAAVVLYVAFWMFLTIRNFAPRRSVAVLALCCGLLSGTSLGSARWGSVGH